jgi:hypothetical protein
MSGRLARSVLLLALSAALPLQSARAVTVEDPFFGEALFHAYQGHYFEALERLDSELAQHYGVDEPNLDSLHPYIGEAEFSVGDFELRYRMHLRAGRAIRAVLAADVDPVVRADAAVRLARLAFQKERSDEALEILDAIETPMPPKLHADAEFLRANALLALDRPDEAAEVLSALHSDDGLAGFTDYNLGIALLEAGRPREAVQQLDRAGRIDAPDRATRAIRDKTNLVLGTLFFEAERYARAYTSLERVRLEGPFANQALLRAGWAEASLDHYERAVVPWSLLAERDSTDSAVQEALLALPYAYSKLEVHGRAAVLYEKAARVLGSEIDKLAASIRSVENGTFLEALSSEEIRQDRDWVVRLRTLPDAPETFYLVGLMASNDFQTALQNYLDLADMQRKLEAALRSLDAFDDLIAVRRAYYTPLLPEIDAQFRHLDAQMRIRIEQRDHIAERLEKLMVMPTPELLATGEEAEIRQRLAAVETALDGVQAGPRRSALEARLARLRGLLTWRLETTYPERLSALHERMQDLNRQVERLESQYDSFVRARQAAVHSHVGYDEQIARLRVRSRSALRQLEIMRDRQGKTLEGVAIRELQRRHERLEAYRNQARFAFADSYDRAAKAKAAPPAAMPAQGR